MEESKMKNIEKFYSDGFLVVDDFLDDQTYKRLLKKFQDENDWERVDQIRPHYQKGGPFEMESQYFPGNDEEYYLQGWRAKLLEQSDQWRKDYSEIFIKKINQLFQNEVKNDTTYILKYMKNDFSRIHVDDLRGEVDRVDISILYYLCNQWIWDWGGILMIAKSTKDEDMHAIMPKGNRIIFINNQKKLPHCVTPVANYAKENRFAIASFIGCNEPF
jgi:Rps23 Pro-64 3,4-dihydroxylase Tpa1-like proline 4-hydroxylase